MQSLATFMTLGLNKIMALFSESAVFILGVYFKIQSFIFMPVFGLNNGLTPVVGYNYGARSRGRIVALIRFALEIGVVIMAVGTLLLALFPHRFLQLFHAESNVLATGVSALRMISSGFVFAGVSVILCAAFQAMGASMLSLAVSLSRQLVLILPGSATAGPFLTTLYVAVLPHCGASLVPAGAAFLPQGLPREACAHVGEMSFVS